MLHYWMTVKGIKWLPYALGALLLLWLVWAIHEKGYDAGYNASQAIAAEAEKAVMLRHIQVAKQVADIDLEAVVVTATKKDTIRYVNQTIVRTIDTCDSADWLREYNERVRAAGTGAYTH